MAIIEQSKIESLKQKGLTDQDIQVFAKKYGYQMPDTRSFGQRLGQDFFKRGQNIKQEFQQIQPATNVSSLAKNTLQSLKAFGRTAGQVAGGVGDIVGETLTSVGRATGLNEPVSKAVESVVTSKPVAPLVQKAEQIYSSLNPELQKDLDTIFNTVTLGGGTVGTQGVAKPLTQGIKTGLKQTGEKLAQSAEKQIARSSDDFLKELVTPIQTIKQKTKDIASGLVEEGGLVSGRTRELAPREMKIVNTLKTIPEVSPKNTLLENVNVINRKIADEANDLDILLGREKIVVPKREAMSFVKTRVNELIQESPEIVGDVEKVAQKTLNTITKILEESDGTAQGLLRARKKFDRMLENVKGSKVFESSNAIGQVVRRARTSLNEFIADLTDNVDVKASLSKQSDLYRAVDLLAPKASREAGTKIGRLFQKIKNLTGLKNDTSALLATLGVTGAGVTSAVMFPIIAGVGGVGLAGYGAKKLFSSPQAKNALSKLLKAIDSKIAIPNNPELETLKSVKKELTNLIEESKNYPNKQGGFIKTGVSQTDNISTDLLQEAKKYKSAEDFVKAQGTPVYHGSSEKIVGEFKTPLYTSPNKEIADMYKSTSASSINPYKKGGSQETYELIITAPKKRILDLRNKKDLYKFEDYFRNNSLSGGYYPTDKGLIDWTEGQNLAEYIKEKKLPYDAVLLDEGKMQTFDGLVDRGISTMVLNPKVIKTKSQLEEIWKKVNKK